MKKTLRELMPQRGMQKRIADHCNVSPQAVSQWFEAGVVPAKKVRAVSELTQIARCLLNPDVFPTEEKNHA